MSFEYSSKEKTISYEGKLTKDKIRNLFNGIVVVRKTWRKCKYRKKHAKRGSYLKYKVPKSKIIGIINVD